jgi:Dolichyl-phosphate-mannose-protein mannosyltransferase
VRFSSIRRPAVIGIALLALILTGDLARSYQSWTQAQGWEYEWIARAWADGKGYSYPGGKAGALAYSKDQKDPNAYYATAWEEPVPVLLLGTFFRLFGDYGRLAMTLANALFFGATLVLVYHLGRWIAGPWLGLISAALLALIPGIHSLIKVYIGGSMLAGLLVSVCALLLLWFQERPSVRRGLLLGGVIGFTVLTQAATIAFIPAAGIVALLSSGPLTWRGWGGAGVIVGAALLLLSPWAVRNYITFDEFVPVRNGAGYVAYVGNRALAETFKPSLVHDDAQFKPPWTAENLLDAVRLIGMIPNRRDLETYAQNTVGATAPDQYADFNEAQRDKALMAGALDFMFRHPLVTLQLATAKAIFFFYQRELRWQHLIPVSIVGLLAILGLALSLKDRRAMALGLMALAYVGVYSITFPFYYRYRYPIEPVLAVLAGISAIWLAQLGCQLRERLFGAPGADAPQVRAGPSG